MSRPDDLAPAPPTAPAQAQSVTDPLAATGGAGTAAQSDTRPVGTERYALLGEIARGGMGVIFRATDTALGREVAIKVLVERFAPDSGTARRFADEARIAAQLQHPGIPPVHDVGTLADGRPFLAMKLIKGQVLDQVLDARPDLSAERGRYVAIFEQVCQAIAYAHSRSVIHRDLKPSNVMVGPFGEVQVMDWGLAKVLSARPAEASGAEDTAAGTLVVSLRDSDGAFTQAGTVLGTPAFMSPEQAVGAVGRVDQRSDVFGLGAILAVILTGKPPFAATSAETTRVKAAQGDVADCFARLDGCGAEQQLVALCKRCLSPKAPERPADAGVVAREVAGLRQAAEERARAAELERVRAEGERAAAELRAAEQRRRRRIQVRATLQTIDPEPFRDAVRNAVCGGDLATVAKLAAQPEALAQPPGFASFLGEKGLLGSPERLREVLGAALHRRPGDLALLMGLGTSFPRETTGRAEDRARWYQAAVAVAPASPVTHNGLGLALFDLKDLEGAIAQFQEAIRIDPDFAPAHNSLGMALDVRRDLDGALAEYRACLRLDPTNYAAHNNLGWVLRQKGDLDGAIGEYREALRIVPESITAHANLGGALQEKGDLDGAIAEFQVWLAGEPGSDKARACLSWAQQTRALLPRLGEVLAGKDKPKNAAEALDLAKLCGEPFQKRYAGGARLYADAFAADPALAEDLKSGNRYNAACSAALGGCGEGKDAAKDETARARLRRQALGWLQADLAACRQQANSKEAAQREEAATQLAHWLVDSDLKGLRASGQVAMSAEERAAWDALWAEVKATLALAQRGQPAPPGK
jgi:Flp pilus assembly protein TadD